LEALQDIRPVFFHLLKDDAGYGKGKAEIPPVSFNQLKEDAVGGKITFIRYLVKDLTVAVLIVIDVL